MKFNMKSIQIIPSILSFFEKTQEILRVVKAFAVGYDAFMKELKGEQSEEK